MSKFIKSAKHLLQHDKASRSAHGQSADLEEPGDGYDEAVAVPALGHTTGYAHEQTRRASYRQAGVESNTIPTSPTSTSGSSHLSSLTPTSPIPSVSSAIPPDRPIEEVPARNAKSEPAKLKQLAIDRAIDRPICDVASTIGRDREERIARQVEELAAQRGVAQ